MRRTINFQLLKRLKIITNNMSNYSYDDSCDNNDVNFYSDYNKYNNVFNNCNNDDIDSNNDIDIDSLDEYGYTKNDSCNKEEDEFIEDPFKYVQYWCCNMSNWHGGTSIDIMREFIKSHIKKYYYDEFDNDQQYYDYMLAVYNYKDHATAVKFARSKND